MDNGLGIDFGSMHRRPPLRAPHMKSNLSRRELELAAAAAIELQQRKVWRAYPDVWCRERINIEPSWKVHAAQALGLTIEEYERKHGGEMDDKIIEVLESVRDNPKTLVQSGHQIGKTLIAAAIALWFLDVYRPSRVITTSATWTDVETKLWGTIRSLYRKNGEWFGVKINETALKIADDHYALGLSPKEVESFQGHNAAHVLVEFDESSSIDQKFFDASDAEATRQLATGNPLLTEGPFYKYSKSSEWHTIKVSCYDHPNVKFKREIISGGPRASWVESRKKAWGAKGPLFLSRVLGEFPEESEDTLFSLTTLHACFDLWEKVKDLPQVEEGSRMLGLDVARMGGDKTVGYGGDWCIYNAQLVKRVRKVLDLAYTDHHSTRMKVAAIWRMNHYNAANIDAGGEGSGLCDELPRMGEAFSVNRILFGSNPADNDYFNARAEMYWQLSTAMKTGNYALEPDDELEEELSVTGSMRDYKEKMVSHKKQLVFWLPPKEEIKLRLLRSPDKADGLALENYKGRTGWFFESAWGNMADQEREALRDKAKIEFKLENAALGDAASATQSPSDPESATATKKAKRTLDRVCTGCASKVAEYTDIWRCNNCGLTGVLL